MKFKLSFDQTRTIEKPDGEVKRALVFAHDDGKVKIRVTIAGDLDEISDIEHGLECVVGKTTTLEIGGPEPGQTQLG